MALRAQGKGTGVVWFCGGKKRGTSGDLNHSFQGTSTAVPNETLCGAHSPGRRHRSRLFLVGSMERPFGLLGREDSRIPDSRNRPRLCPAQGRYAPAQDGTGVVWFGRFKVERPPGTCQEGGFQNPDARFQNRDARNLDGCASLDGATRPGKLAQRVVAFCCAKRGTLGGFRFICRVDPGNGLRVAEGLDFVKTGTPGDMKINSKGSRRLPVCLRTPKPFPGRCPNLRRGAGYETPSLPPPTIIKTITSPGAGSLPCLSEQHDEYSKGFGFGNAGDLWGLGNRF